jgi:hypothetical protein
VIADAGHIVNLEKPEEFRRVVLDFLSAVCSLRAAPNNGMHPTADTKVVM